ncbi:ABC transporter permease [Oculatella sp. LEGE 06141]|uniref:ABC transporter permease n=1 Tax=Oculatella sp. LEGE 06141 TaxID=1828648 RepID=UPI00187E765B|nr:ABC transporter permease [Oculatella sp. LEGE 06141]MBE9180659.1 ABC transporter permease [Oculatella sp. LEGE 06141]
MSLTLVDLFKLTCHSLNSNRLRSALTTLGVFMGVTAVSATLQVGSISRAVIEQRLAEREAPHVTLFPMWVSDRSRQIQFQLDDLEYLQRRLPGLQASSASAWAGFSQVVYQTRKADSQQVAVSEDFLLTTGQRLVSGRFFTVGDFASYRPVVVIDQLLATQLFQEDDPIGQRLYADRQPYVVVGVIPTLPNEFSPPEGQMLVPISFYNALQGTKEIGAINLRPTSLDELEALGDRAKQLLQQRFPGADFYSWNNVEDILEQRKILTLASNALAAVGAISLLVGGIGIANIMIASVTERTSEIGLRRAIGATRPEIMGQFILEATVLSVVGGLVAIATVHGITVIVADRFALPYEFEMNTAAFALGAALAVGIGASLPPAIRASRLDPVKALRSD